MRILRHCWLGDGVKVKR